MKGKKIISRGKIALGRRHESQDDLAIKDTDNHPKLDFAAK
jgi:hypothetical protein